MFAIGWNALRSTILSISILFALVATEKLFAQDVGIFEVRNTLALSNEEPTYKDYYLNAGSDRGLRTGMIITVVRKVSLYDSYQNKAAGEMMIEVGKIKIIHVQKDLAVARDHSSISRVASPLLDYDFVMLGDVLNLDSMVMEGKTKNASVDVAPAAEAQAQVPAPAAEPSLPTQSAEPQASLASGTADLASKTLASPSPEPQPAPVSTLQ